MNLSISPEINLITTIALVVSIISIVWSAYIYKNDKPKLRLKLARMIRSDNPSEEIIRVTIVNYGRQPAFIDRVSFFSNIDWISRKIRNRFLRKFFYFMKKIFKMKTPNLLLLPRSDELLISGTLPTFENSIKLEPGARHELLYNAKEMLESAAKHNSGKIYCQVSDIFKSPIAEIKVS